MKSSHRLILLITVVAITFIGFINQNEFIREVVTKLHYVENRFPVEKVYLHFDKDFYALGEKIWFKAYVAKGVHEMPTNLSKILYVNLLAPDNSVYAHQKIKLVDGVGEGSFHLDGKPGSGNYKISAYTNWNRNFDSDFFFSKEVSVYDFRTEINDNYSFSWSGDDSIGYLFNFDFKFNAFFKYTPQEHKVKATLLLDTVEYSAIAKPLDDSKFSTQFLVVNPINTPVAELKLSAFDEDWIPLSKVLAIPTPHESINVKFFPEGGDFAADLRTRVAFKATDAMGNPIDLTGVIKDGKNTEIAIIQTEHDGLGSFFITPEKEGKYFSEFIYNQQKYSFELPEISKKGLTLSVVSKEKSMLVIIQNNNVSSQREQKFTLIGQSGNRVYYAAEGDYSKPRFAVQIDKDKFPAGVVHFTLFNDLNLPIAERLAFIENKEMLDISVKTDKEFYAKRDRVEVKVIARDKFDKPIKGSFSLSVLDQDQVNFNPNSQNIESYYSLSSDLRGSIRNPGYYFNPSNANRDHHLDLLLLTHGWRRFKWDKVLNDDHDITKHLIEDGLSIYGEIDIEDSDKPAALGDVDLIRTGDVEEIYKTKADITGKFILEQLEISGSEEIVLVAKDAKGSPHVTIHWDSTYHDISYGKSYYDATLPKNDYVESYLKESKIRHQINMAYSFDISDLFLEEITVTAEEITKQEQVEEEYMKIYKRADVTVNIKDMPGKESALSVLDLLLGKVPGLIISGEYTNPTVIIRGTGMSQYESIFEGFTDNATGEAETLTSYNFYEPLFVVDGVATDKGTAMVVPVNNIDHVDVLKGSSTAMFGNRGANGIIAIYTLRGEDRFKGLDGVKIFEFQGYHISKEFYSPDYSEKKEEHIKPDFRSTVYWNPNIETDQNGEASVVFYTTDRAADLHFNIQGISKKGYRGIQSHNVSVLDNQ